jgi:inorganic pyrophosphatase
MEYKLNIYHRNTPDQDLLDDLKKVADKLETRKLSSRDYDKNGGKYTAGTVGVRFGGWNNALEKAGLEFVHQRNVSQEELFKNIEEIWVKLGRQPVHRDLDSSISKYSTYQYIVQYGTWRKALEAFIEYINSDEIKNDEPLIEEVIQEKQIEFKHKTKRFPSERLKVQVLMRDGNKCNLCGITVTGEDIHFDHIKPWSKGGETVLDNIQVLCAKHNLAKGDLEYNEQ